MLTDSQIARLCGWRPNWRDIDAWIDRCHIARFAHAAPDLMKEFGPDRTDRYLWDATVKVTGAHLPAHNQQIGDCTSHGWSAAIDYLSCTDIAWRSHAERYAAVSHAAYYGFGRELAGMLGGGDGCYGAAMAEAGQRYGHLTNEETGDRDDDSHLSRPWGDSGVPQKFRASAEQHKTRTVALCKSFEEAKVAIQGGYPVPVASNQGFTLTRDRDGFCRAQGQWPHQMCFIGYRADREGLCCLQSWGPETPGGPLALGQPHNSFWVEASVADDMLAQGDSHVVSLYDGWPAPAGRCRENWPTTNVQLAGALEMTHRFPDQLRVLLSQAPPSPGPAGAVDFCSIVDTLERLGPAGFTLVISLLRLLCPPPPPKRGR